MENTNTLKMKWYNYLVYFWLPINVFVYLLSMVFAWRIFSPTLTALFSFEYELIPTREKDLFLLIYMLLFMLVIPFIYTVIVRRKLRKFSPSAPEALYFWYILPILLNAGLLIQMLFQDDYFTAENLLFVTLFDILRALVVIPSSKLYFYKRAELFQAKPKTVKEKQVPQKKQKVASQKKIKQKKQTKILKKKEK